MAVEIYHNARCSKSRQTLELLKQRKLQPKIIDYLQEPPDAAQLKALLSKLGIKARDLLRKKEAAYTQLGLDDMNLTEEQIIQAMTANPILIERPIVVNGERAAIGRPPESVLAIL